MSKSGLPKHWEQWPLADIGTWIGGGTPSKSEKRFWEGSTPWVSPKDMKALTVLDTEHHISEEAIECSAAKLIPAGAVLLVTRSGILSHSLPVATTKQTVTINQDLKAIEPAPFVNAEYIAWFLRGNSHLILNHCTKHGTTVASIEVPSLKSYIIRLPPLSEQHRIVAKIEELFSELDKGIESLKSARAQLKVYRQAVLKHAFEGKLTAQWREENKDDVHGSTSAASAGRAGAAKLETADQLLARIQKERDALHQQQLKEWKAAVKAWEENDKPGEKPSKPRQLASIHVEDITLPNLPNEWAWEYLGNLNADVFDGPFGSNLKTSDYVDKGIRVIRLENIGYLEFIEEKHSYVTEEKYKSIRKHTVSSGDIIFSSFIIDGIRVAILPDSIVCAVNKADCFCVRLHGDIVRNDFVANFLSTRSAYKQVESEIHGIGRPRINTTQLKSFAIPICSREEQNKIMSQLGEKLSLADNIATVIDQETMKSETLRQSILKKAFSGQLVPQDPNDEPASVLLERIKAEKDQQAPRNKTTKRKVATA